MKEHQRPLLVPALCVLACGLLPATSEARTLIESEDFYLDWTNFLSQTGLFSNIPYEVPGLESPSIGAAGLWRMEWRASSGNLSFEVHNRLFWRVDGGQSPNVGLGASVPPPRWVDLRTPLIERPGQLLEHDFDRLSSTWLTPVADITVGRQAVTWGAGALIGSMDFWTQLSPFDLDSSQKRGVDAVRAFAYVSDIELDFIVVDRGTLEDLSGGAKAAWSAESSDYHLAVAKSYQRVWGALGLAIDHGSWRSHGEIAVPYAFEESQVRLPKASVGSMWTDGTWSFGMEYHFNGLGSPSLEDALGSEELARGEMFFLGRHYAAVQGGWTKDEFSVALFGVGNLADPSVLLAPSIIYTRGDNTQLRASAFVGVGDSPTLDLSGVTLPSEFGLYGQTFILESQVFF